jgi:alkylation response protein AidB-like acyl-CoA dehydrogenase
MTSKYLSRRDLEFYLYEWLQVEKLTARPRFADHSRETFDAALDTCEQIADNEFYPINKLLDAQEPHFDGEKVHTPPELAKALKAFCDAGLMAAGQDFDRGGMQLPHVIEKACFSYFKGASVGAASYPFLTIGNANLLLAYGTPEQVKTYVDPMMKGRFFGTMCLSEPQAGSSLSDIRTKAQPQADGSYRIFGNKMWISAGEHELSENIIHLVLAKVPDANGQLIPGVKGISLFIVPKKLVSADGSIGERNDVTLAGLNHKMGYRGTTNCLLNFGEGKFKPNPSGNLGGGQAGAVGYLVGQLHNGLTCMFHMMNEARIGVGLGATMLGYAGYLHSLDYARNRPQGRAPQNKDPVSDQIPIIQHTDVKRMLLAQKSYVEGAMGLNLYCAQLVDDLKTGDTAISAKASLLLEMLTPVAKSWPSQWCVEANNLAIQIHGGYGYTRDYNVEQYYRDNRLNPIHEGTHGIQGLDLLGRKVRMQDGAGLRLLSSEILQTVNKAAAHKSTTVSAGATKLQQLVARIEPTLQTLYGANSLNITLANATVFLEAFGHIVVGWIWLEQALLCANKETDFHHGKLQAAQYFFLWELPKVDAMLDLLCSLDSTTLGMEDNWF